jgi:hypothetical protein
VRRVLRQLQGRQAQVDAQLRQLDERSITVEGEPDAQVMGQALHGAPGYNCRLP